MRRGEQRPAHALGAVLAFLAGEQLAELGRAGEDLRRDLAEYVRAQFGRGTLAQPAKAADAAATASLTSAAPPSGLWATTSLKSEGLRLSSVSLAPVHPPPM